MNRIVIENSKVQKLSSRILRSPTRFWRRVTRSRLNPAFDARRAHCSTLHTRMITHWRWDPVHFPFISFEIEHRILHSRPSALNRPSSTSPPLLRWMILFFIRFFFFLFTYRRSVWRLSRSTSSWFNEKVDCVTRRWTKN